MTTPEALNALADRVEREEPSRALEGDIFEKVGGQMWDLAYARAQEPCGCPEETARNDARLRAPRYTTSLDAAVTLVPTNFSYELTFSAAGEGAMRRARLWDWRRGPLMIDPANEWAATAKTLPAAFTAAALRARAADMQARAVGAPQKEAE